MSRLDARYRLLVRVYPPGRRRAELLDTLVEAGRRQPTIKETINLLRYGLRARLGRPAGRGVVVLAVCAALVTGFTGAAVAARLAWEFAPDYPTGPALTEITDTVFPGLGATAEPTGDGSLFFDPDLRSTTDVLLRGHNEDFEFVTLLVSPPSGFVAGGYPQWTAATRDRLMRAGWEVADAEVTGATFIATGEIDDTGRTFTATRDGLGLRVDAQVDVVGTPQGSFYALATLDRLTPGYVNAAAVLGLLAGALIGWLLTGWLSRRTEGAPTAARGVALTSSLIALLFLLPQALLGYVVLVGQAVMGGPPGKPFWTYSVTYAFGCALLGVVLLAVAFVSAALAGRPSHEGDVVPQ